MYSGMAVFRQPVFRQPQYKHFLSLCIGIRLLCELSDLVRNGTINEARLLEYFVWNTHHHYGQLFNVYNVHGLLHMPDDVETHGKALDDICAFPFENYLGWLKRLTRGKRATLIQITKRLNEWYGYHGKSHIKVTKKYDTKKNSWFQVVGGYFNIVEI